MIATKIKNEVLESLAKLLNEHKSEIVDTNRIDLNNYCGEDESMYDRLKVDERKVVSMLKSIEDGLQLEDPEGKVIYSYRHPNGMKVENRTVPFGNILIIYESRPDVTIEAALTAFKAGNKILLKGGKEARNTNLLLTRLWHEALDENSVGKDYVTYLDLNREATQALIKNNTHNVDLIIPRGGEGLINFVKQNTNIPVIVSGRGNNFLYVDSSCNYKIVKDLVINGKSRISVCNALDKVLIDKALPDLNVKVSELIDELKANKIQVIGTPVLKKSFKNVEINETEDIWYEEFLSSKIMIDIVDGLPSAIARINKYSGGHSATIVTDSESSAIEFMNKVDAAAVYHNASTRFTDGGQFGFGAEMAISTQKVHFRGPVSIGQLVTNKWFIFGDGQTRI